MRKYYLTFMVAALLLCHCQQDTERKIKLAPQTSGDMFSRQAQSIQLAAAKKLGVAIFPFTNKSNRADLDWMCQGFPEMLITQFSQFNKLNLTPSRQTQVALERMGMQHAQVTPEQTVQLGKLLNAGILITGDYDVIDDEIALNVQLHDVESGRMIQSVTRTAPESKELFTIVDDIILTFRDTISSNADYSPEKMDINQASISTNSVAAFEYYSKGVEANARFDRKNAKKYLEKALEEDSTFVTALAAMGELFMNMSSLQSAKKYYAKAMQYAHAVSPQERLKIEASLDFVEMDFVNALAKYEKLAELYPEDHELHYSIGGIYFSIFKNYPKAAQAYRTTLALDPEHKLAINQLAYCLQKMGREQESYKYLQDYITIAPDEPNPYDSFGEILMSFGHLNKAIKMFDKALEKDKTFIHARLHKVNAYIAAGKTRLALRMLRKMKSMQNGYMVADIYSSGAKAELAAGHHKKSVRWLEEYLEKTKFKSDFLYLLHQIDPGNENILTYFHEWLQNIEDPVDADINQVLGYAILALYINDSLHDMQHILKAKMASVSDPVIRQSGLSLLQTIEFFTGTGDVQTTLDLMAFSDKVNQMSSFTSSWETYWYNFFKATAHAYDKGRIDKNYFIGMQHWASQAQTNELYYFSQIGLANFYEQDGDDEKAAEILNAIATPMETDWSVIGPFHIHEGMMESFWPEKSSIDEWFVDAEARGLWVNRSDSLLDGYLNIGQIAGAGFSDCVYAVLPITVSSIQDCQIRFSVSGNLKLWLNNRLMTTRFSSEQATLDSQILSVRLNPGTNWLMIRVCRIMKNSGFYFRITDQDGHPLKNLDFTRETS